MKRIYEITNVLSRSMIIHCLQYNCFLHYCVIRRAWSRRRFESRFSIRPMQCLLLDGLLRTLMSLINVQCSVRLFNFLIKSSLYALNGSWKWLNCHIKSLNFLHLDLYNISNEFKFLSQSLPILKVFYFKISLTRITILPARQNRVKAG